MASGGTCLRCEQWDYELSGSESICKGCVYVKSLEDDNAFLRARIAQLRVWLDDPSAYWSHLYEDDDGIDERTA